MKTCTICKKRKPLASFHLHNQKSDGRHPWCAQCRNQRNSELQRMWTPEERLRSAHRAMRWRHGVDINRVEDLYNAQDGRCAICRRERIQPGSYEAQSKHASELLHIDHDHKTGTVRGLLCFDCNTGIGKLGDSADLLQRAVQYLLKDGGQ